MKLQCTLLIQLLVQMNVDSPVMNSKRCSAGNWSGAGATVDVIQQIASEGRRSSRLNDNAILSLDAMRAQFNNEEVSSSLKIKGYIQYLAASPLVIHLWNEGQIRLWHDTCRKTVSFLDATGTVIQLGGQSSFVLCSGGS